MNDKTNAVEKPFRAGIFESTDAAETAVKRLRDLGFTNEEIAVLCSDESVQRHFPGLEPPHVTPNDAANAAIAGSMTGAVLGGLAGVAAATVTGWPLFIIGPGVLGGALGGSFVGAMSTRGVEKEIADFYDQSLTAGQLLVAVEYYGSDADEKLAQAEKVLQDAGAKPLALTEG